MEFHGNLSDEGVSEIIRELFPRNYMILVRAAEFILVLLGVFLFRSLWTLIISVLAAVMLEYLLQSSKKKMLAMALQQKQDASKDDILYSYTLREDGIHVTNLTTGSQETVLPEDISRYIETANYIVFYLKDRRFFPVNRDDDPKGEISAYLKEKGSGIKLEMNRR